MNYAELKNALSPEEWRRLFNEILENECVSLLGELYIKNGFFNLYMTRDDATVKDILNQMSFDKTTQILTIGGDLSALILRLKTEDSFVYLGSGQYKVKENSFDQNGHIEFTIHSEMSYGDKRFFIDREDVFSIKTTNYGIQYEKPLSNKY